MRKLAIVVLLAALQTSGAAAEARTLAPLPDGVIAHAEGDVIEAVLIGRTTRYRHFVLGTRHEALGLRVRTASGVMLELILPDDSVFEDRQPRIADLDGDGRNEVVLVRSRQSTGSALVVLGLRDGRLTILAESTPNGAPNRWLNPAGIGRFFANGRRQVALVRMPHAVGRLEFWDFDGRALKLLGNLDDTSNHVIGSRQLNLSLVVARAGRDFLAVPDFSRRRLRLIAAEPTREVASFTLPVPVTGNLRARSVPSGLIIEAPLANGQVHDIIIPEELLR